MRVLAFVIGVFYVFGELFVLRRIAMERVLNAALERVTLQGTDSSEMWRMRMLIGGTALCFAAGLALMALSRFAVPLFLIGLVWQAVYLMLGRRMWPPQDDDEAKGRRASTNAFWVFALATAFVVWIDTQGILRPWALPFLASYWRTVVELGLIVVVTALVFGGKLRQKNLAGDAE